MTEAGTAGPTSGDVGASTRQGKMSVAWEGIAARVTHATPRFSLEKEWGVPVLFVSRSREQAVARAEQWVLKHATPMAVRLESLSGTRIVEIIGPGIGDGSRLVHIKTDGADAKDTLIVAVGQRRSNRPVAYRIVADRADGVRHAHQLLAERPTLQWAIVTKADDFLGLLGSDGWVLPSRALDRVARDAQGQLVHADTEFAEPVRALMEAVGRFAAAEAALAATVAAITAGKPVPAGQTPPAVDGSSDRGLG